MYKGLLRNKQYEMTDDFERVILSDSLPNLKSIPDVLIKTLKTGTGRRFEASKKEPEKNVEHWYRRIIENDAIYVLKNNRRQQDLNTCGYWALFNTFIAVLIGSYDFYEECSIQPSPQPSSSQYQILEHTELFLLEIFGKLIPPLQKVLGQTYPKSPNPNWD